MEHKYIKHQIRRQGKTRALVGDDPVQQDKYYGWLYHKAQCRYRSEEYQLTWPEWDRLWGTDNWSRRGRALESLCMIRLDTLQPWSGDNVDIVPRSQHLRSRCIRGPAKNE